MSRDFWLKFAPFLLWWPEVNATTLQADTIAAITGAIVVLPQGVAFATIAGMPPEYGLYAAMVPAIIAALFGSSRLMVSGPATPASIVLFSSLSALAVPGSSDYVIYALTLTFMVGVIELAMGLARLGALVNFISHSVVVGFTAGAAVLIIVSQLGEFFGVQMPRGSHLPETLTYFFGHLGDIQPYATAIALTTLVAGIYFRRRLRRIPYMILAMIVGSVVAFLISRLLYVGGPAPGIREVGALPATLPPLSSPQLDLTMVKELAPVALAVTLFALTEAMSIARALAARRGDLVDGNQEFIGQGLSNIAGSFFSSYVSTGSFNRSGVNWEVGAKTPLAAAIAGVILMVVVLFVAPMLAHLPKAAMAGILFLVGYGIIDFTHIVSILRASRSDSIVLCGTFVATLLLSLDFAIMLGVLLSLVIYLNRASQPRVRVQVPDPRLPKHRLTTDPSLPECPQFKIVRIDGALFFGAVNYVAERLRVMTKHNRAQKHLLIMARTISFIDVAGAELLAREARFRRGIGGQLYFHQLHDNARELLERGNYLEDVPPGNLFESKGEAITEIFNRLDRGICVRCDKRIFHECRAVPKVEIEDARTADETVRTQLESNATSG